MEVGEDKLGNPAIPTPLTGRRDLPRLVLRARVDAGARVRVRGRGAGAERDAAGRVALPLDPQGANRRDGGRARVQVRARAEDVDRQIGGVRLHPRGRWWWGGRGDGALKAARDGQGYRRGAHGDSACKQADTLRTTESPNTKGGPTMRWPDSGSSSTCFTRVSYEEAPMRNGPPSTPSSQIRNRKGRTFSAFSRAAASLSVALSFVRTCAAREEGWGGLPQGSPGRRRWVPDELGRQC